MTMQSVTEVTEDIVVSTIFVECMTQQMLSGKSANFFTD